MEVNENVSCRMARVLGLSGLIVLFQSLSFVVLTHYLRYAKYLVIKPVFVCLVQSLVCCYRNKKALASLSPEL